MNKVRRFLTLIFAVALSVAGVAQSYPPVWNASNQYVPGDQVQLGGNVFRCISPVTRANQNPARAYSLWELATVRANTILAIGAGEPFPTLNSAWNYALNATIAGSARLIFNILTVHGAYNQTLGTTGFCLDHPFGSQISITSDSEVGNEFYVPTSSKGFFLDSGHTISSISNLQIVGSNTAPSGISASGNATIGMISNCYVNGFVTCIQALDGATISLDRLVTFSSSVIPVWNFAVAAQSGGRVHLAGTVIDGTGNSYNSFTGLYATSHGHIDAPGSIVRACSYGVQATDFGDVNLTGCTLQDGGYGIYADRHGFVEAQGTSFTNVAGPPAIYCYHDSHVVLIGRYSTIQVNSNKMDGSVVDIEL